ncbi:MAG: nicotinate phosphoribosyltransferase [Coriobacteriales bacterium]|jgi:nicotinate phosphoribosyltransferase|nr:nicotinate phosphoribosyltransferase [Coriobacteriales bacterium]
MRNNPALFTDLYELTMAQAAWTHGQDKLEASFYLHFRDNPFNGGYAIACGAARVAEIVADFKIEQDDIDYLATLPATSDGKLFSPEFLQALADITLSVDIDCVSEGTAVFAHEPILRVTGPFCQCLLLETALLNALNFETLIATKAARICMAASGPVAEFGARRAQGLDGAVSASRAAIVGGCASTSNILAAKLYDLPVSGTHSHAWVMAAASELEAFRRFVEVFPQRPTLLVDTYDTIGGIKNAIIVGHEMQQRGQQLGSVRIDSGDLAWLSLKAREMLDAAGLEYVQVVASNDLDENTITSLLTEQTSRIDAWGVGTRLACAYNQPALGGVYKLSAIREPGQPDFRPVIKVSDQIQKSTLPGLLAIRRYFDTDGLMAGDMIFDLQNPPHTDLITDPFNPLRQKDLGGLEHDEVLQPLARAGRVISPPPAALKARENTLRNLERLSPSIKRLLNPHSYPVGLEATLLQQRDELLGAVRAPGQDDMV